MSTTPHSPTIAAGDRLPDADHLAGPVAPLGNEVVKVAVGEVVVAFEGLSQPLSDELRARFGPFVAGAEPAEHHVAVGWGDERYLDPSGDRILRMEELALGEGRTLVSYDFAARWSGSRGVLRLATARPGGPSGAVENYLRWVAADLVLDRGSFILHASGLERDGRAYVFFGPSGAGKTTVVQLSPGLRVLSDDLVLLTRRDGAFEAACTPFSGSLAQVAKERGSFPVARVLHLRKALEDRTEPLSAARGAGALLAACPFVGHGERRFGTLFPLVEELAREPGVAELYFRKDASFWNAVLAGGSRVVT